MRKDDDVYYRCDAGAYISCGKLCEVCGGITALAADFVGGRAQNVREQCIGCKHVQPWRGDTTDDEYRPEFEPFWR